MFKKTLIFIFFANFMLLIGCSQPSIYDGIKYPRTVNVEVFNSPSEVHRHYKVMGRLQAYKYSMDIVRQNLMSDARRIGADAVIIKAYETTPGSDNNRVLAEAIKYDK